mmetsp:Transcript_118722/g.378598  ORF Transcript_118722/g.378598 Transcript_118722/m.378598 type:complete len:369 (-) Transcript_118722:1646-2752(-)
MKTGDHCPRRRDCFLQLLAYCCALTIGNAQSLFKNCLFNFELLRHNEHLFMRSRKNIEMLDLFVQMVLDGGQTALECGHLRGDESFHVLLGGVILLGRFRGRCENAIGFSLLQSRSGLGGLPLQFHDLSVRGEGLRPALFQLDYFLVKLANLFLVGHCLRGRQHHRDLRLRLLAVRLPAVHSNRRLPLALCGFASDLVARFEQRVRQDHLALMAPALALSWESALRRAGSQPLNLAVCRIQQDVGCLNTSHRFQAVPLSLHTLPLQNQGQLLGVCLPLNRDAHLCANGLQIGLRASALLQRGGRLCPKLSGDVLIDAVDVAADNLLQLCGSFQLLLQPGNALRKLSLHLGFRRLLNLLLVKGNIQLFL